jgi:hypothetical protein
MILPVPNPPSPPTMAFYVKVECLRSVISKLSSELSLDPFLFSNPMSRQLSCKDRRNEILVTGL